MGLIMGHTTVLMGIIWDFINTPNPSMNKTLWLASHMLSPLVFGCYTVKWLCGGRNRNQKLLMPNLWTASTFQLIRFDLVVVNFQTQCLGISSWDPKEMWEVHRREWSPLNLMIPCPMSAFSVVCLWLLQLEDEFQNEVLFVMFVIYCKKGMFSLCC